MKTKPKMDLKFYVQRAVDDFKTLVIYFNVVRPQYEPAFRDKDGKFSFDKLKSIQHYLKAGWRAADDVRKYNRLSAAYNYTFGIPNELVRKVMGEYVDENGKHIRIPITSIVKHLQKAGFLGKVINDGKRLVKDKETGKCRSICHWRQKYPMANVKYWAKLISDENYRDIDTIPNASSRVKRIIMKWHKSWAGDSAKPATVEPTKTIDKSEETTQRETIVRYYATKMEQYGKMKYCKKAFEEIERMSDAKVCEIYQTFKSGLMKRYEIGQKEIWPDLSTTMQAKYPLSDDMLTMFGILTNIRILELQKIAAAKAEKGQEASND